MGVAVAGERGREAACADEAGKATCLQDTEIDTVTKYINALSQTCQTLKNIMNFIVKAQPCKLVKWCSFHHTTP